MGCPTQNDRRGQQATAATPSIGPPTRGDLGEKFTIYLKLHTNSLRVKLRQGSSGLEIEKENVERSSLTKHVPPLLV